MASELDKLLVKMGLKEERVKATALLPATSIASGALGGGILGLLYANPNDFGGAGKALWKEEIFRNPSLINNLKQAAAEPRGKRTLGAMLGLGKMGTKMGLKAAIPYAALGLGIDLLQNATETDTYWNKPDDVMKKIKGRLK
jgi:hypothetical protein